MDTRDEIDIFTEMNTITKMVTTIEIDKMTEMETMT